MTAVGVTRRKNQSALGGASGCTISANGGSASQLVFSDIAASGVTFVRNFGSDDLQITVAGTGKTITVRGQFNPYGLGPLQSFAFADGTVWTAQQVKQMLLDQESAAAGGSPGQRIAPVMPR